MTQNDSDGIPRMGDDVESILRRFTCTCGQPRTPGVTHYYDGRPCEMDNNLPPEHRLNPQTGSQEEMHPSTPTWIDRLKAEHWEMDKRGMALSKFLRNETGPEGAQYKDLAPRDQFLLGQQMSVMSTLFQILTTRLYRAEHPEWAKEEDRQIAEKAEADRQFGQPHYGHGGDNDDITERAPLV